MPVAEDLEDLQLSGNEGGTFEELASPSQQHLQQQLINVLSLLSLRDSFIALPAVSRSMHQLPGRPSSKCRTRLSWVFEGFGLDYGQWGHFVSQCQSRIFQEEVFTAIRTNHLWPTEGFPPVAPLVSPSEALHSPLEVLWLGRGPARYVHL